jgi:NAD(P)-dependent dehydrogenase (short-subunit alcohol dehydrogenase family)
MAALQQKVVFIVGGGPRIGHAVAKKFLSQGYKVAIGRRQTDKVELEGALPVYVDVTKPETIEKAFTEVESKLGVPTVVVYNGKLSPPLFPIRLQTEHGTDMCPLMIAAALTFPPDKDPFGVAPEDFARDLTINASAAYATIHHATRLARRNQNTTSPLVFIATGNVTPFKPNPLAVTLGSGKSALAHVISIGSLAYDAKEFR